MYPTGNPVKGHKGYIYPDGSYGVNKPSDGQIFNCTRNGVIESTWQWDDIIGRWFNISTGKPTPQNTASYPKMQMDTDYDVVTKVMEEDRVKKCECGSAKIGSVKHSTWCQLYDSRS